MLISPALTSYPSTDPWPVLRVWKRHLANSSPVRPVSFSLTPLYWLLSFFPFFFFYCLTIISLLNYEQTDTTSVFLHIFVICSYVFDSCCSLVSFICFYFFVCPSVCSYSSLAVQSVAALSIGLFILLLVNVFSSYLIYLPFTCYIYLFQQFPPTNLFCLSLLPSFLSFPPTIAFAFPSLCPYPLIPCPSLPWVRLVCHVGQPVWSLFT